MSNNAVFATPALTATTRYRLVVTDAFGSAQTHVLVTVIGRPVEACTFTAITAPAPDSYGLYYTPISGDGSRVALAYTYHTAPGTPPFIYPIEIYDVASQAVVDTISTEVPNVMSLHLSDINYDGSVVAFVSIGNHSGGNADGGYEVFIWEEGQGITQLTNSPYPSADYDSLSISGDGNTIVFASDYDADGDGEYLGEIYYYKWERGVGVSLLTPTSSGQTSLWDTFVVLSSDGTATAFASSANPLGQNADGNRELFLLREGQPLTTATNAGH
jgi:Tol biopolymer transport system component